MTLPTALASGRVNFAPDDDALEPNPTWVRLDDTDNLVASYTIDRGRQFEVDRTDGGRATVVINDVDGILDPTNTGGPYYTKIEPLVQMTLGRWNPVLSEWQTRFRGFIAEYDYAFDSSQQVNRLTLELVDIFEILNAIQMLPGQFGDSPPPASTGQVFFDNANVGPSGLLPGRLGQIMGNAGIASAFYVFFSGNVGLYEAVYSPGESPLAAMQEAVDAEFPGVSNLYPDRFGRAAFHGRLAKFDPATIAAVAGNEAWDWHHWHAGDGAAVAAALSTTAQIREFAMNRGLAKIINSALATPLNIADADVAGQMVTDPTSIGLRGIRSWSATNLLTKIGLLDSSDALTETKRFATFYVSNFAEARNRVSLLGFRSMDPADPRAAANWKLLCESDIADQIDLTIASPGGGDLNAEPFYIEGVHETNEPLNAVFDKVTISFDVSPAAYFTSNPFPTS